MENIPQGYYLIPQNLTNDTIKPARQIGYWNGNKWNCDNNNLIISVKNTQSTFPKRIIYTIVDYMIVALVGVMIVLFLKTIGLATNMNNKTISSLLSPLSPLDFLNKTQEPNNPLAYDSWISYGMAIALIWAIYAVVCYYFMGATIGQKLFSYTIVEKDGTKIQRNARSSILRAFLLFGIIVLSPLFFLNAIWTSTTCPTFIDWLTKFSTVYKNPEKLVPEFPYSN